MEGGRGGGGFLSSVAVSSVEKARRSEEEGSKIGDIWRGMKGKRACSTRQAGRQEIRCSEFRW